MTVTSTPATTTNDVVQILGNGDVKVGDASSKIGFYGKAPAAQPTAASITDYATLKVALQNLGLIGA